MSLPGDREWASQCPEPTQNRRQNRAKTHAAGSLRVYDADPMKNLPVNAGVQLIRPVAWQTRRQAENAVAR